MEGAERYTFTLATENHTLNPLKRLASQTIVYGIPSIAGRFLNYLLTYLYTRVFSTSQFGVNSEFYAYSGFFAVLLAFGMETAFFRFNKDSENKQQVFSTSLLFITGTSLLFLLLGFWFAVPLADALQYSNHVGYIRWLVLLLAMDAVCAIPFARLRSENKALQFAGIKVFEIVVNIGFNIFFLILCRKAYQDAPGSAWAAFYNPEIGVGYVFISNLIASGVKMVLLLPQFRSLTHGFDVVLFKKMIRYAMPMVLIGFAGIVNEMLDRMILKYMLPYDETTNLQQLGIYGACYKLSIIMSLFIQAFRFAAEPFFFSQADRADAKKMYADVMKYFTIFCAAVFLGVTLYMPWVQLFIGEEFRSGLHVVPVLLLGNLFLGVYVNLSIWYKLTDRTLTGALVSVAGALLTVLLNVAFIPEYGFVASAWATLACYFSMAVVSYFLGQKYYPVQYDLRSFFKYLLVSLLIYFCYTTGQEQFEWMQTAPPFLLSSAMFSMFLLFVAAEENLIGKIRRLIS